MRKLLTLLLVSVLAVVAAGCGASGGSDSSGDNSTTTESKATTTEPDDAPTDTSGTSVDVSAEDYTAAFVSNLSTGSIDDGDLVIAADEAECVAPRFLDAITVEVLQENEVTPEDVSEPSWDGSDLGLSLDQGQLLVDSFGECDVDIFTLFATSLTVGLTEEQQACAVENVDPDLTEALLVKTFSTGDNDAEFEAVIGDLTSKCDLPG